LEEACRLAPTFALLRTRLGNTYYRLNRLDDAAREHEAAIAADAHYHEPYIGLAMVELRKRNLQRAADLYRRAIRLSFGSADAHSGLGVALFGLNKRDPEALTELQLATRVDSKSAQAWYNLGQALEAMGDKRSATECLARAASLDPRFGSLQQR